MGLGAVNILVIEAGSWGSGSFREGLLEEGMSKLRPKGEVGRSSPAEAE